MVKPSATGNSSAHGIKIAIKSFGPTSEELASIGERLSLNPALLDYVGHSRARLLYVEALEEAEPAKGGRPKPPSAFRATLYDDKRHRTILAEGLLSAPRKLSLTESALPRRRRMPNSPLPSRSCAVMQPWVLLSLAASQSHTSRSRLFR